MRCKKINVSSFFFWSMWRQNMLNSFISCKNSLKIIICQMGREFLFRVSIFTLQAIRVQFCITKHLIPSKVVLDFHNLLIFLSSLLSELSISLIDFVSNCLSQISHETSSWKRSHSVQLYFPALGLFLSCGNVSLRSFFNESSDLWWYRLN
jgi:hypothetical protein